MENFPEDWQRAIVIVAHPDDIEYGAAAAVAQWTDRGKDVRYVLATRGEAGIAGLSPEESGPIREEEERRSAAIVGVGEVEFLGLPDGRLVEGLELRSTLAAAIRRHRPELVVTMNFSHTWGPGYLNSADHRALGISVLDATADAANEWIFPSLTAQGLAPWPGVRWVAVNTMTPTTLRRRDVDGRSRRGFARGTCAISGGAEFHADPGTGARTDRHGQRPEAWFRRRASSWFRVVLFLMISEREKSQVPTGLPVTCPVLCYTRW